MDNKKFEQLIDMIINENEEQARALFHDIVVEKSREIYENIIAEEMEEEGQMGGQVGDLLDEIGAEESGVVEADDEEEFDISDDDGEEHVDFEAGEGDEEGAGEENLEDRVVDLEDKLDQLMAEFEEIMGGDEEGLGDEGEEGGEEDFGGEEMMEAADDEEDDEEEDELDESVMEAIALKKVSVTHGDNGQNTKSPSLTAPKVKAAGVNPVKFDSGTETMPTSPKGPSNAYSKGETQVKHAGQWKNAPAQAGQDLEKAPAPKKGDDGQNTKSPLGESRKATAKKRI
jgi:hypothetical protein